MGLALGIDYSLFVLSRYREERQHGLRQGRRDRRDGRHRQQGSPVQRQLVRRGAVRAPAGARHDPAQPRLRRDHRRAGDHGGRADPAPGDAGVARRPGQRAAAAVLRPRAGRGEPVLDPGRRASSYAGRRPPGRERALPARCWRCPCSTCAPATPGVSSLPDSTYSKAGFLALERSFPRNASSDPAQVVVSGDVSSPQAEAAHGPVRDLARRGLGLRSAGSAARRRTVTWPDEHPAASATRTATRPGPRWNGCAATWCPPPSAETDLDRLRRWHDGGEHRLLRPDQPVAADRAGVRPRVSA